jgi:hypothetical protein
VKVEEHEVDVAAIKQFESRGTIRGFEHGEAFPLAHFAQQLAYLDIVVDEEEQRLRLAG